MSTRSRATHSLFRIAAVISLAHGIIYAQSDPNRGLWVGEVTLKYVNEVAVPLNKDNVPIAPNPKVPTKTSDAANLKLILHVNGNGQVSLLKDVALLGRKDSFLRSENDLALITDERLYGDFPPQPAVRIASAVFDFGDPSATRAVSAVVDAAVEAVYLSVKDYSLADLDTAAERDTAETAAFDAANAAGSAPAVIPLADAAAAFFAFRTTVLNLATIDGLAAAPDPSAFAGDELDPNALRGKARLLQDNSFYGDSRGLEMINAIVDAIKDLPADERQATARAVASSYADLTNKYQRFIAGESFGDMITAAAEAAAEAGKGQSPAAVEDYDGTVGGRPTVVSSTDHQLENGHVILIAGAAVDAFNGTHTVAVIDADNFEIDVEFENDSATEPRGSWVRIDPIEAAANEAPEVSAVKTEAITVQVAEYSDKRATAAVEVVIAALVDAAAAATLELAGAGEAARAANIASAGEAAAREALARDVPRYSVPEGVPSVDYTDFVQSDAYQGSAEVAARAAADAAVFEMANNILANERSIRGRARAAAIEALDAVFSAAARVAQTRLPFAVGAVGGGFGANKGDPRLTAKLEPGDAPIGSPALEATIVLAANHPTNPFRHRRHPDHTTGFEITRKIALDFDPPNSGPSPRAGFGVDRLTGVYREDILGLHKPLGPDPEDDPIGLRVEGTFEIYRVSLIDTLNAR